MNTIKTNEASLANLHNEWLQNLATYNKHLQQINVLVGKLQPCMFDNYDFNVIQSIKKKIEQQLNMFEILVLEIKKMKERFLKRSEKNSISISDLIENNRLRDRVRKTEQTVFMLNNEVNKLNTKSNVEVKISF